MTESRKLAGILVADVVGYSRLAGAEEDRTLGRLRGLRSDLIDLAIAAHYGRIAKRSGDGSIIEPRGVVDAVRSAIEPQNGLIERNVGSASWRQSLLTPILEIEPLRNGLRANKARQSELVDSNIGEAANRRTAAITRPARG